jgi:hypothetical protein
MTQEGKKLNTSNNLMHIHGLLLSSNKDTCAQKFAKRSILLPLNAVAPMVEGSGNDYM